MKMWMSRSAVTVLYRRGRGVCGTLGPDGAGNIEQMHLSRGDVEGREELGRAVELKIVAAPLRLHRGRIGTRGWERSRAFDLRSFRRQIMNQGTILRLPNTDRRCRGPYPLQKGSLRVERDNAVRVEGETAEMP